MGGGNKKKKRKNRNKNSKQQQQQQQQQQNLATTSTLDAAAPSTTTTTTSFVAAAAVEETVEGKLADHQQPNIRKKKKENDAENDDGNKKSDPKDDHDDDDAGVDINSAMAATNDCYSMKSVLSAHVQAFLKSHGPKKKKKTSENNNSNREEAQEEASPPPPQEDDSSSKDNDGNKKKRARKDENESAAAMVSVSSSSNSNSNVNNPLYTKLQAFLNGLTRTERDCFFSNQHVSPERRAEIWMQQADLGEQLVNSYSWAIPPDVTIDDRCMRILAHFAPLVEMGCGKNAYWCRQMKAAGIDVIGYDSAPESGGLIDHHDKNSRKKKGHDFRVRKGGPKDLTKHSDRTLFLCYPDENDEDDADPDAADDEHDGGEDDDNDDDSPSLLSMGSRCLQHYTGDHVIHVGEAFGETNSMEQAPWGRSSSPEFQQYLAAEFHCILQIALPSWLHVRDSLSVWKRSETCTIVFAAEDDDDDDEEGDQEVQYRHVPVEERLPTDRAAPCVAHLLDSSSSSPTAASKRTAATKSNKNHHHEHSNKKPKLAAKQATETQASSFKRKSNKQKEDEVFSEKAGYDTPW